MTHLKSGELAKAANVNTETLRYYEREGLLPLPDRSEVGYRQYPVDSIKRVQFIKHAQALGFTLAEIHELLAIRRVGAHSALDIRQMSEDKIKQIDEKISGLEAIKHTLLTLITQCHGEQTPLAECPILNCLESPLPTKPSIT